MHRDLVGLQAPSNSNALWKLVHMMGLSLQSSEKIRAHQSPMVKKIFRNAGFLCTASTGPKWAWNFIVIFSIGVFPLRLQDMTYPCSVPTINLVVMVGSYSRDEAPDAFDKDWSSGFVGSSMRVSVGSDNFRVSHLRRFMKMEWKLDFFWNFYFIKQVI